ncbi:MAG: cytochrome-c oxidase, cbb3-type subunit III, partial [Pseudomonadota bacterium]|nr:cytochrome-c oxidase, cbb3-type subunit III [Pseudomonadota bacterium]
QWWFKLFILTVVFALGYLVLYPGLGNYAGILGWSQESQWEEEVADAEDRFTPIFAQYQEVPIPELARDGEAMQVAERIFLNNCAVCHGSNAQGGYGFPNLTDDDWLYGGEPENILTTLNNGRNGLMPSWQQLGENNIENLTQYVLSLSNLEHDEERAASGESTFLAACAACHTPSGTGNTALGAPNLTNDIWLYQAPGQSVADSIRQTLRNGRNGHMPAQAAYIGEERVHLVAAYVYSLRFND